MQKAIEHIKNELTGLYPDTEIRSFTYMLISRLTGFSRVEIIVNKNTNFSDEQLTLLDRFLEKLKKYTPIQYIFGECDFMGMKFMVNDAVLIPRPETEELVEWITESGKNDGSVAVLDIGTGSGCIAIGLKSRLADAEVTAYDISAAALDVARKNAELNGLSVHFEQFDILELDKNTSRWNIIVSNPPYIPENEKSEILPNVLNFEPHVALFVPENDPLLFYRHIIKFAQDHLKPQGQLFFEIHRDRGQQVVSLLTAAGFVSIELRKDLSGNDRMTKARKP